MKIAKMPATRAAGTLKRSGTSALSAPSPAARSASPGACPTSSQIASTNRSLPDHADPWLSGSKATCKALARCSTGKNFATSTSQSGAPVSGYQMPEMKESGQDQHVGDDGSGLGVGDDHDGGHAQRGEGGRAQQHGDDDGRHRLGAQVHVEADAAEDQHDDGHDDRDEGRRAEAAAHVGPARQRRAAHALEQPVVALDRDAAGHVHELGDDDPVGEDARQEEGDVGDVAQLLDPAAAVERAEEQQEHDRHPEGEEGPRAVAPEGALLVGHLPRGQGGVAGALVRAPRPAVRGSRTWRSSARGLLVLGQS